MCWGSVYHRTREAIRWHFAMDTAGALPARREAFGAVARTDLADALCTACTVASNTVGWVGSYRTWLCHNLGTVSFRAAV